MRKVVITACVIAVGCARGAASGDTAVAGDSVVVDGPPADAAPPPSVPAAGPGAPATPQPRSPAPVAPPASASSDSVRGTVAVVGTSFERRVMIVRPGDQPRVEVTGPQARLVGHVAGAEVLVVGSVTGRQVEARSFVVRSVDGQPAIDGTLRTQDGVLYIVTANGARTRIVTPPPPLVGQDGSRVWITGDPARGVDSFGFIDPPR